jgi:hypothetical protein
MRSGIEKFIDMKTGSAGTEKMSGGFIIGYNPKIEKSSIEREENVDKVKKN